ncbi:MAG: hypothetical protein ABH879_02720 [archaeon]
MFEFNADGSIRLPDKLASQKSKNQVRLRSQRCMEIKRDLVSTSPPKRCIIHLTISQAVKDHRFVDTIHKSFAGRASVPSKIVKVDERNYDIEIGTDFRRCTDCSSLINEYREFLDGNIIEDKGCCTFEPRSFAYEDYFE